MLWHIWYCKKSDVVEWMMSCDMNSAMRRMMMWDLWCHEINDAVSVRWESRNKLCYEITNVMSLYIHVCYLSICFHVLQELTQQGGWKRDVIDPISVELDQGVRGELNQAILLSGINVPTHQYVHCVLYNNKTMQKCQ